MNCIRRSERQETSLWAGRGRAKVSIPLNSLQEIDDDTLALTLKTLWSDGTTHLLLSPLELIEKLPT